MIINVVSPSQHELLMMSLVPVNMKYITWYYNQCCESESTYSNDNVACPSQHEIHHIVIMLLVPANIKYSKWYHYQCCECKSTWNLDTIVSPSPHEIYHMIIQSVLWVWVNMKYCWCCWSQSTWSILHDIIISVVSPNQHTVMMLLRVPVKMKYIT